VKNYCESDHKPVYGIYKALATKEVPDKKEEIVKKLHDGIINHQNKEAFNQNKLLSFAIIKRRTTVKDDLSVVIENLDDPWAVNEGEDGTWGLANVNVNIHHKERLSKIFELYNELNYDSNK